MLKTLKNLIADFNAGRELKKHIPELRKDTKDRSAAELVDLLYSERWERFFWIKQVPSEIKSLANTVEELRPKVVVEIGTNMGGSLFLFTKKATHDALIISIDLPGGLGGGGYPDFRAPFYRSFAGPDQTMHLLRLDSHQKDTYEQLLKLLDGKKIDFLFLDGDHSYEGIKMDFDMYSPLVRQGGIIAFHDIKPSLPDNWRQVGLYWEHIKQNYEYSEFLSNEETWGGIGILKYREG